MTFHPVFSISNHVATALLRIERVREAIRHLPITARLLSTLRESARLASTHYSTMIEGNRLSVAEVAKAIQRPGVFPGRERDEAEVRGYYAALEWVEKQVKARVKITETAIRTLHSLVMAEGKTRVRPTPYRHGQNVIRDSLDGRIVYLPPDASDVPDLMRELVAWLNKSQRDSVPCPIRAAIAHYQFATIHPYYDGNGRTARLLTTMVLHLGGYDLKGVYSLDEYYGRNLPAYYQALTIGPSHNYYFGRAEAEITSWIEYFCDGMADSCEAVCRQAVRSANAPDASGDLRSLDPRQRRALELFRDTDAITAVDVAELFGLAARSARHLLQNWVAADFLEILDPAKKSRKYGLSEKYKRRLRD